MTGKYKIQEDYFDDWTQAQECAFKLLSSGVPNVRILIWNEMRQEYGLLQELNLRRGVIPNPNWSTWFFAPYFWKQVITQES